VISTLPSSVNWRRLNLPLGNEFQPRSVKMEDFEAALFLP